MTKDQLDDFYKIKTELEIRELEINSELQKVRFAIVENRKKCDGKMPNGQALNGFNGKSCLCYICQCWHDFDLISNKDEPELAFKQTGKELKCESCNLVLETIVKLKDQIHKIKSEDNNI